MKRRTLKTVLFSCLMLLFMMAATVSAQEEEKGSIRLQTPKEAQGAEIKLYRIAEKEEGYFVYSDEFSGCGVEINDLNDTAQAQDAAEKLEAYALEKECQETASAVCGEHEVYFSDLEPGLYLAIHTQKKDLVTIQPMLIGVPMTMYGEEIYEVIETPKYSLAGGAVIINKVDQNGNPLGGAHFVLQKKETEEEDSWKEYAADLVSGENGQIVVTELPVGIYRFLETEAPEGYEKTGEIYEFEITGAGAVEEIDGIYQAREGNTEVLTIVNNKEPEEPLFTPTETPIPEEPITPRPNAMETPTPEVTATPTPEATETPTPEATETPTPEATATLTPELTETPAPSQELTETPTPTLTAVPGTGGNSGSGESTPGSSGSMPVKTGDETPFTVLFVLLFASAAMIAGTIVFLKNRKEIHNK